MIWVGWFVFFIVILYVVFLEIVVFKGEEVKVVFLVFEREFGTIESKR